MEWMLWLYLYVIAGMLSMPLGMSLIYPSHRHDMTLSQDIALVMVISLMCGLAWPVVIFCWLYVEMATR